MSAIESDPNPTPLGRRIIVLFAPHRRALAGIGAIILVTSALSVIAALLVRQVFNNGLFGRGGPDLSVLIPLVAVLVAIPIVNGVLNIVQTWWPACTGPAATCRRARLSRSRPFKPDC